MANSWRAIRLAFREPWTYAAAVVCLIYVLAFRLLFTPPLSHLAAASILALGAFACWGLLYSRTEDFLLATYGLDRNGRKEGEDDISPIAADFRDLGYPEGEGRVRELRRKYENLADILGRRLSAGEVTHGRYLGMAEGVYRGALENLRDVGLALRNLRSLHPEALSLKLSELRRPDAIVVPEAVRAIQDRKALYEEERRRIASLLGETEAAMTTLDRTATALARTRTGKVTDVDLAEAMKELEALAGRTSRYSSA